MKSSIVSCMLALCMLIQTTAEADDIVDHSPTYKSKYDRAIKPAIIGSLLIVPSLVGSYLTYDGFNNGGMDTNDHLNGWRAVEGWTGLVMAIMGACGVVASFGETYNVITGPDWQIVFAPSDIRGVF
ncbi:MAG: hypothetical protein KGH64_00550 [Candidatus Micrarchaeota archaeon]|nr:hypothetical protein [Candidatus Micrarchaeota archaeon]